MEETERAHPKTFIIKQHRKKTTKKHHVKKSLGKNYKRM
jgi:hypothetical protein